MATPTIYEQFKLSQHDGGAIDWDTDTIKVMLLTSTHAVNQAHDFISDIDANEVTAGGNYAAGGATIANASIALDTGTVEMTHDDVTWAQHASNPTNARHAVWYKDTGVNTTSPIIMSMDLGSDVDMSAGALTLDVTAATGVLQIA